MAGKLENTARDDLTVADRVYAVVSLKQAYVAIGKRVNDEQLASEVGMSRHTVVRYLEVGERLTAEVLRMWQDCDESVGITLNEMYEVSVRMKGDQATAFRELAARKSIKCTSCDDKGCGFCVPNEPHGQPTD